jgi:hypothetical protein
MFLAYLDHVLCPKLQPGGVIVMDNLSSHKLPARSNELWNRGEIALPPPYSPDLNPSEKALAELKQLLRSAKARLPRLSISPPLKPFRRSPRRAPKPGFDSRGFNYINCRPARYLIFCECNGKRRSRLDFSSRKGRLEQL